MHTLETLRRQIESTNTLHSVVRTMKALAMTSIQEAENASKSLTSYYSTVRLGLQIASRHQAIDEGRLPVVSTGAVGAFVFGSAWGMCGRFNDLLAHYTGEQLAGWDRRPRHLVALGEHIGGALEAAGWRADSRFDVPDSVAGITDHVQDLLVLIEQWRTEHGIDRVVLFYNQSAEEAGYGPQHQPLLPLDRDWLDQLRGEPWPTHVLPTFRAPWSTLFASLVRQYLFVFLHHAFAEPCQ